MHDVFEKGYQRGNDEENNLQVDRRKRNRGRVFQHFRQENGGNIRVRHKHNSYAIDISNGGHVNLNLANGPPSLNLVANSIRR